jgi:hypothetical protein
VATFPPDTTTKEHHMSEIIDIKRPPTATQVEELRKGAAQRNGIIALGDQENRTQEGLARRGMGEWKSATDMGERGTHSWFVITQRGRDYLAKLDGTTPVAQMAEEMTRDDVAEGKRQALAYLGFGERRREAEQAPASVVLEGEFKRVRTVMRRAMKKAGAEAAHQALKQYNRTEALLIAARRFEQEDAAQEAAKEGSTMTETATPAEERTGEFTMPVIDYRHRPRVVVGGVSHTVMALVPQGAQVDEGTVRVTDGTNGRFPHNDGKFLTATTADGERIAVRVDCYTWEDFQGYQVRTEQRGEHIVAVYVKGSANDIKGIEQASRAYARKRLAFADGCKPGPVGGGGEFADGGATYISQDTHVVKPLPRREG